MTTFEKRDEVVRLFTVEHLTTRQIGEKLGITHAGAQWHLRKAGIAREQGTWVTGPCTHCGEVVRQGRSRFRHSPKGMEKWMFCRAECYYAYLESKGNYRVWRQGQRIARAVVAKWRQLQEDEVVHHWDGDNRNNAVWNLAVFATNAEHMRHHRGGKAKPVWDGRTDAVQN